jgi:hypothetical protein
MIFGKLLSLRTSRIISSHSYKLQRAVRVSTQSRYVSPHNSMIHFFQQYMKLQEKIDVAEDSNEFQMEDKILRV